MRNRELLDVEAGVDGLGMPARLFATAIVAAGTCMSVLDATIANVALPTFVHEFQIEPAVSIWIVNAFQLAVVATLLPLSALGARFSFRRVYIGGLIVFTVGSLFCALARTFPELVAARVLQGFGAGGIVSVGPALYRFIFPQRLLGQGIGISSLVVATSAALGPTAGGLILSIAPWFWIFAINVPIGIVAMILAPRYLPESPLRDQKIDLPSVIASAVGLSALILSLDAISRRIALPLAQSGFVFGMALLVFFVWRQLRIGNPLVEPALFRIPRFSLAAITSLVSFVAQGLALISLPFLLRESLHANALTIGLLLSAWPISIAVVGPVAGRLSDTIPAPVISTIGLAILSAGLFLQGTLPSDHASIFSIVLRSVICGVGFGCFQPPNNRELMGSAPRELAGNASGVLATVRVVGQTCGAAFAAVMLAATNIDLGAHAAFIFAGGIAAIAAAVSATRIRGVEIHARRPK